MSLFITIFSQTHGSIRAEDIKNFVEEGGYFDPEPNYTIAGNEHTWTNLEISYNSKKQPIIISQETDIEEIRESIDEVIEEIQDTELTQNTSDIITALQKSSHLFSIEIDAAHLSDDGWEFLDNMEAWIATETKGLIYIAGEGVYDVELNLICKL